MYFIMCFCVGDCVTFVLFQLITLIADPEGCRRVSKADRFASFLSFPLQILK